jgi:glycosyltransferase involved in cell wall biosynthesis
LGRYKGHDIVVDALNRLPNRYKLLIIGGKHPEDTGSFFGDLLSKIEIHKLESRVRITGWKDKREAAELLAASDICVAPYRETNLSASGALTWALASGKPVIATNINAFVEISREVPTLNLISQGSVNELVWNLLRIEDRNLEEPELRVDISKYISKYSWKNYAELLDRLYKL